MEQDLIPTSSSPPSDHDQDLELDHEPDFSPVGSPELAESHFPQQSDLPQTAVLSDDLRNKIIKQVEYYFCDENLPNDKFLMKYVTKNAEGFVPVGVIASFRKMKKLTRDVLLIVAALRESEHLVVSSNGKKVKRLHPLPLAEVKDPMLCTVLVENLPEDHSVDNLQRVFGEAGNIKHITIRDPHATREPKKYTIAEKLLSGKLHALVEYDTVEAAEKAVVTLNNEQDWRFGLRVKLLKKASKPGQKKKNWRESEPEKSSNTQVSDPAGNEENHYSSEHHEDSHDEEISGSRDRKYARRKVFQVRAMDDDSVGVSSLDWGDSNGAVEYILSSSDGEDSDGEIILQPITDVDLPTSKEKFLPTDDSITVTAHRLAMLGRARKKNKTVYGILNNVGLITFSTLLLFLVDQCAWRIVRLPLAPFYLMRPFMISAAVVSCIGYICVPLFRILKLRSIRRNEAPFQHSSKKGTPTMGGLYFVPIGTLVAEVIVGFSSAEISAAVAATLAFAAIGLVDDFLSLKNNNSGLSGWMRILLEVAVGSGFSCWLYTTNVSSPYSMKMVVPLPAPVGLVCLGKVYPLLSSFCFVSMANGINLTDGLDGLAGGIAALTFIGMSIAVLPICSDVAIFGASMAGACVGFLLHNRYKASIFMGDTGALALGAALAAMASCTGMFFPLFISSGIFVLEVLSVIIQVCIFRTTKYFRKTGFRFFRMAPFHHHLELCGIKEPKIVAAAYMVTGVLILCGAYVGLISV